LYFYNKFESNFMRTRKIVAAFVVGAVLSILPSCNIVDECGECELITEAPDGTRTYGTPQLLCGDELKARENEPPENHPNGDESWWNCY
jgi:hypothetical protein